MDRWVHEDPADAAEKMDKLLVELARQHRLMAAASRKDKPLPKGIPHSHVFAILEYDATTQLVRMFNPWGNYLRPDGPSGPINGYATRYGIFDIPLGDFLQIFGGFTYENDQLISRG